MKTHIGVRLNRVQKTGSIGIRCDPVLEQFFTVAAEALDLDKSKMVRAALKNRRRELLQDKKHGPVLRQVMKARYPHLLHET